MITGRKLGSVSGPEIIVNAPKTSEHAPSDRMIVPKGVRSVPSSAARSRFLDDGDLEDEILSITSRPKTSVTKKDPVRSTTPTALAPKSRQMPVTQQLSHSSSRASAAASAPAQQPVKISSLPVEPTKDALERATIAAKWLHEEKSKGMSQKQDLMQRRAKAYELEQQIARRRSYDETNRVNKDLQLLLSTKSYEGLFIHQDDEEDDTPTPLPPPPAPFAPVARDELPLRGSGTESSRAAAAAAGHSRKARTDSGLKQNRPSIVLSGSKPKPKPSGSPNYLSSKAGKTPPSVSPGVPIVRRVKKTKGNNSDDDEEEEDGGDGDGDGRDDYSKDGFNESDEEGARPAPPTRASSFHASSKAGVSGKTDQSLDGMPKKSLLEELEEKTRQERLEAGRRYAQEQKRLKKLADERQKKKSVDEAEEKKSKLLKLQQDSRLRVNATVPKEVKLKLRKPEPEQENIPVYASDQMDLAIAGDQFFSADPDSDSDVGSSVRSGGRGRTDKLSALHERIRAGLPPTPQPQDPLYNPLASIAQFYKNNQPSSSSLRAADDHLEYVPPKPIVTPASVSASSIKQQAKPRTTVVPIRKRAVGSSSAAASIGGGESSSIGGGGSSVGGDRSSVGDMDRSALSSTAPSSISSARPHQQLSSTQRPSSRSSSRPSSSSSSSHPHISSPSHDFGSNGRLSSSGSSTLLPQTQPMRFGIAPSSGIRYVSPGSVSTSRPSHSAVGSRSGSNPSSDRMRSNSVGSSNGNGAGFGRDRDRSVSPSVVASRNRKSGSGSKEVDKTPKSTRLAARRLSHPQPQLQPQGRPSSHLTADSLNRATANEVGAGAGRRFRDDESTADSRQSSVVELVAQNNRAAENIKGAVERNASLLRQLVGDLEKSLRESVSSVVDMPMLHGNNRFVEPNAFSRQPANNRDMNRPPGRGVEDEFGEGVPEFGVYHQPPQRDLDALRKSVTASLSAIPDKAMRYADEPSEAYRPSYRPGDDSQNQRPKIEHDDRYGYGNDSDAAVGERFNPVSDLEPADWSPRNKSRSARPSQGGGDDNDSDMVRMDDDSVYSGSGQSRSNSEGEDENEDEVEDGDEDEDSAQDLSALMPQGGRAVDEAIDPVTFHRLGLLQDKKKILQMFGAADGLVSIDATGEPDAYLHPPGPSRASDWEQPQPQSKPKTVSPLKQPGPVTYSSSGSRPHPGSYPPSDMDSGFSLRNVGELGGILNGSSGAKRSIPTKYQGTSPVTHQIREPYVSDEEDSEDSDSDTDGRNDHRIVSIMANEIIRQRAEEQRLAEEKSQAEMLQERLHAAQRAGEARQRDAIKMQDDLEERLATEKLVADSRDQASSPMMYSADRGSSPVQLPSDDHDPYDRVDRYNGTPRAPQPKASGGSMDSSKPAKSVDPVQYWDSLLNRPLADSTDLDISGVEKFHKIVPRINPSLVAAASETASKSAGQVNKPTASDLRIQMLEELHRQEDMFKYAFELSELEQANTIQSASQLVQMLVSTADQDAAEYKRQQEMISQQQAYELSLASASVGAQMALQQQQLAQEKELMTLQAQMKIDSMHSYFLTLRKDADQMADTLEHSAQLLDADRMVREQALRLAATEAAVKETLIQQQQTLLTQQQQFQEQMARQSQQAALVPQASSPVRTSGGLDRSGVSWGGSTAHRPTSSAASSSSGPINSKSAPIHSQSQDEVDEYDDDEYNEYSNTFDQESIAKHHLDKSALSIASSIHDYGRPPVAKQSKWQQALKQPQSGRNLNQSASSAVQSVLDESISSAMGENSIQEIGDSFAGSASSSRGLQHMSLSAIKGPNKGSAKSSGGGRGKAPSESEYSFDEVPEEDDEADEVDSVEEDEVEESMVSHKLPPRPSRASTQPTKPVSKPRQSSKSDYSTDNFEEIEESRVMGQGDSEGEEIDEEEPEEEFDEVSEENDDEDEDKYSEEEEDYSQAFDESIRSEHQSYSSKPNKPSSSSFNKKPAVQHLPPQKTKAPAVGPRPSTSLDTHGFKAARSQGRVGGAGSAGDVTRSVPTLSFRNLATLGGSGSLENSSDAITEVMISEYKSEMENRLRSQEQALKVRQKILKARRQHQLQQIQARSDKMPKKAFDAEVSRIEDEYSEGYAELERDRWELNAKSYKELRRFNRVKKDLDKYRVSLDAISATSSPQVSARDSYVEPQKVAVKVAPQSTANKAGARLASAAKKADVSMSSGSIQSESYESSFESVADTEERSLVESPQRPKSKPSPAKGIAYKAPQGGDRGKVAVSSSHLDRRPVSDDEGDYSDEVEEEIDEEADEIEDEYSEENEYSQQEVDASRQSIASTSGARSRADLSTSIMSSSRGKSSRLHQPDTTTDDAYGDDFDDGSIEDEGEDEEEEEYSADKSYSQVFDVSHVSARPATKAGSSTNQGKSTAAGAAAAVKALVESSLGESGGDYLEMANSQSLGALQKVDTDEQADSGNTVDELDESIELHKKRIDELKANLESQQADRAKLEIIREKAAEKKKLIDLEAALRRELMEESARIKEEKSKILSLEYFNEQQSQTGKEPPVARKFEDREKMSEWISTIADPLEHEEGDALAAEDDLNEDSWASAPEVVTEVLSAMSSLRPVKDQTKDVQKGLLYQKVRVQKAATLIQAFVRGSRCRHDLRVARAESARLREELLSASEVLDGNLDEDEAVAEAVEQLAMDDSFASKDEHHAFGSHSGSPSKSFGSKGQVRVREEESFTMEESLSEEFDDEEELLVVRRQLQESELLERKLSELAAAKSSRAEIEARMLAEEEAARRRAEERQAEADAEADAASDADDLEKSGVHEEDAALHAGSANGSFDEHNTEPLSRQQPGGPMEQSVSQLYDSFEAESVIASQSQVPSPVRPPTEPKRGQSPEKAVVKEFGSFSMEDGDEDEGEIESDIEEAYESEEDVHSFGQSNDSQEVKPAASTPTEVKESASVHASPVQPKVTEENAEDEDEDNDYGDDFDNADEDEAEDEDAQSASFSAETSKLSASVSQIVPKAPPAVAPASRSLEQEEKDEDDDQSVESIEESIGEEEEGQGVDSFHSDHGSSGDEKDVASLGHNIAPLQSLPQPPDLDDSADLQPLDDLPADEVGRSLMDDSVALSVADESANFGIDRDAVRDRLEENDASQSLVHGVGVSVSADSAFRGSVDEALSPAAGDRDASLMYSMGSSVSDSEVFGMKSLGSGSTTKKLPPHSQSHSHSLSMDDEDVVAPKIDQSSDVSTPVVAHLDDKKGGDDEDGDEEESVEEEIESIPDMDQQDESFNQNDESAQDAAHDHEADIVGAQEENEEEEDRHTGGVHMLDISELGSNASFANGFGDDEEDGDVDYDANSNTSRISESDVDTVAWISRDKGVTGSASKADGPVKLPTFTPERIPKSRRPMKREFSDNAPYGGGAGAEDDDVVLLDLPDTKPKVNAQLFLTMDDDQQDEVDKKAEEEDAEEVEEEEVPEDVDEDEDEDDISAGDIDVSDLAPMVSAYTQRQLLAETATKTDDALIAAESVDDILASENEEEEEQEQESALTTEAEAEAERARLVAEAEAITEVLLSRLLKEAVPPQVPFDFGASTLTSSFESPPHIVADLEKITSEKAESRHSPYSTEPREVPQQEAKKGEEKALDEKLQKEVEKEEVEEEEEDYEEEFEESVVEDDDASMNEAEPIAESESKSDDKASEGKRGDDMESKMDAKKEDRKEDKEEEEVQQYDESFDDSEEEDASAKTSPFSYSATTTTPTPTPTPTSSTSLSSLGALPPISGGKASFRMAIEKPSDYDYDDEEDDGTGIIAKEPNYDDEDMYDFEATSPSVPESKSSASGTPSDVNMSPTDFTTDIVAFSSKVLETSYMEPLVECFKHYDPAHIPHLSDAVLHDIVSEQVDNHGPNDAATFERINDILAELHSNRFFREREQAAAAATAAGTAAGTAGTGRGAVDRPSLPKRLLAESIRLTPDGLKEAVMRQLEVELADAADVLSGRKHSLELVSIDVLDGVAEQTQEKLREISNFVADSILARCIVQLANEIRG